MAKKPRREFHFVSGNSSKFWAIELKGKSFDVTYGKLGTNGRNQTKDFATPDKALAAYDKLVGEKIDNGYVEIDEGNISGDDSLSPAMFATTPNAHFENLSMFIGKKVVDYTSPDSVKKNAKVYAVRFSYDAEEYQDANTLLQGFLQTDGPATTEGLVIGNYAEGSGPAGDIVKTLVDNKDKFPNLIAIFFGDIVQSECEISWIENCDMSPILAAFPKLEMLRVRGGSGLEFKNAKHEKLRALGIETGGLNRKVVAQVSKAKFPNLEHLDLWLGTENYGGTCTVNDLQPILTGKPFPKLEHLGVRNSEIADDVAGVIANAPIVNKISSLDLSLGTMGDEGADALLTIHEDCSLKTIDVAENFIGSKTAKKLKSAAVKIIVNPQRTPEDWGEGELMRFVSVSE